MPSKPALPPEWSLNHTAESDPTQAEIDDGYAQSQVPTRQVVNRLFNRWSACIRWLYQVVTRATDVWRNDQILYANTTIPTEFLGPTWPRSTTVPDGWFKGAAIINKHRHGPIDFPGQTLPDSKDCYVDLGDDGVWDVTPVNNGAGVPAVAANHVRFFKFVTNASQQITDGTYYGKAYIENGILIRFDAGAVIDGAEGIAVDSLGGDEAVVLHDAGDSPGQATIPETFAAKSILMGKAGTAPGGVGSEHWWAATVNCRRNGANWTRGLAEDAYAFVLSDKGLVILFHDASLAATWSDAIGANDWTVVGQYGEADAGVNGGNTWVDENGDMRIKRDLAVIRNQTIAGTLQVIGAVTGFSGLTADAHYWNPAKTFKRSFPAAGGQYGSGGNDTAAFAVGQMQPGGTQGGDISIDASGGGDGDYHRPIDLPQGATVTAVRVYGSVSGGTLQLAMVRWSPTGGGSNESMTAGGGGFNDFTSKAAYSEMALTIDQNQTIDNDTYSYYLGVRVGIGATVRIARIEVEYTMTEVVS